MTHALFAGNPNAGKTTLFNLVTGARAKVGNYPGVTVEKRTSEIALPGGRKVTIVDLPGTYSLTARSAEERIAVEALLAEGDEAPGAVVCIADATTLRRGLYLVTQLLDAGRPAVVALTMMDEAKKQGVAIDLEALEREIGCPVVGVVATRGDGKEALLEKLAAVLERGAPTQKPPALPDTLAKDVLAVEATLEGGDDDDARARRRARALWALLSIGDDDLEGVDARLRSAVTERRAAAKEAGRDLDLEIVAWRYARVDALLDRAVVTPKTAKRSLTDRIDDKLMHPVLGLVVFAVVMAIVFQALFSWSEPLVSLIESGVAWAKATTVASLPPGAFTDLIANGVIAGVGNVLVFVPQIALLFVFITVMEDSGYLARVAFVIDRVMGGVGLHGRAFVPMLSGFACAIPAVMATRTIESRRDRLLTMLVVPLTSCSARLPVYVLVTATVFDSSRRVLGVMSIGAVVLLAMYTLSIAAAVTSAAVLRRTVLRGPRPTLVLELPPYRMPRVGNVVRATTARVRRFLTDAGTVILALTIVLWGLLSYPKDAAIAERYDGLRAEAAASLQDDAKEARVHELDDAQASEELRHSLGGRLGTVMEPALRPLGFDWRTGIGLLGAFAAREVFVSTLGVVYGVGEADESSTSLRDALRDAKTETGQSVMTPLTGVCLMVFFVLACQCMSTIAVIRRESGSWKWPAFLFAYMTTLAYGVTFAVHQVGMLMGLS
ncbi:MAG TPA: ferrous iron transport protein B [Polyangiaceae bacterium]|nr:ferrous iron transport protein B [Polyangiaceae bacterium]